MMYGFYETKIQRSRRARDHQAITSNPEDFHNPLTTARRENIYFSRSGIANLRSRRYLLSVRRPAFVDVDVSSRYSWSSSPREILSQDIHLSRLARVRRGKPLFEKHSLLRPFVKITNRSIDRSIVRNS